MSASDALAHDGLLIGAALVGLYLLSTKAGQQLAASVGQAAAEAAGNVASGAVVGIGQAVGIPPTNRTQCQIDIDNGDVWAASFSCPLGDFLRFEKSYIPPDP